jgi:hypothetical protein
LDQGARNSPAIPWRTQGTIVHSQDPHRNGIVQLASDPRPFADAGLQRHIEHARHLSVMLPEEA